MRHCSEPGPPDAAAAFHLSRSGPRGRDTQAGRPPPACPGQLYSVTVRLSPAPGGLAAWARRVRRSASRVHCDGGPSRLPCHAGVTGAGSDGPSHCPALPVGWRLTRPRDSKTNSDRPTGRPGRQRRNTGTVTPSDPVTRRSRARVTDSDRLRAGPRRGRPGSVTVSRVPAISQRRAGVAGPAASASRGHCP